MKVDIIIDAGQIASEQILFGLHLEFDAAGKVIGGQVPKAVAVHVGEDEP